MADNIKILPADLPENWEIGQTVAPFGEAVGLTKQHGFNYLNQQVNETQQVVNQHIETCSPVKVEILETICENLVFNDETPTHTFPNEITLDAKGLYFLDHKLYAANGTLDLSMSSSGFSGLIDDYVRWVSSTESGSITLKSTAITNTRRANGKTSVLTILKVRSDVIDTLKFCALNREGYNTKASGSYAHAEGNGSTASGQFAHAEGNNTTASGGYAHAEGYKTRASGDGAHVEGSANIASGTNVHAEGSQTIAAGTDVVLKVSSYNATDKTFTFDQSYIGFSTAFSKLATGVKLWVINNAYYDSTNVYTVLTINESTHSVSVQENFPSSYYAGLAVIMVASTVRGSHAEGYRTVSVGSSSHAEGGSTTASGNNSHAEGSSTTASGNNSHAEGSGTTASGNNSHAEGSSTVASGGASHTEGGNNTASSDYAHAEGSVTKATGIASHSEGNGTEASNNQAHAEGLSTKARGQASHAEGWNTTVTGLASHAEGNATTASGGYGAHAEGSSTKAIANASHAEGNACESSGDSSHAEGKESKASGDNSHAEGQGTIASSLASHAEGSKTTASGANSHAEGDLVQALGRNSHAEGFSTLADGGNSSNSSSHAEGAYTKALGTNSHAEGNGTEAKGSSSHSAGTSTIANDLQYVIGSYNVEKITSGVYDDRFIVGGGWGPKKNAFRVHSNGNVYGGPYNSSGADYAELFEWVDDNADNADRAGLFVTLEGDKIRLATPVDDYLLGIVSASPSVVGDVYDDQWSGMHLQDVFGRTIYEEQDFPEETGPNGEVIQEARRELAPKLNPDYDHTTPYLPRTKRPEWDAVGMMGKLVAVDDGTCQVNGYATVGVGGVATQSEGVTPYRVMKRLDENHVRILIR